MTFPNQPKRVNIKQRAIHTHTYGWYRTDEGYPPSMVDCIVVIDLHTHGPEQLIQYNAMVYWDKDDGNWHFSWAGETCKDLRVKYWCLVPTLPTGIY